MKTLFPVFLLTFFFFSCGEDNFDLVMEIEDPVEPTVVLVEDEEPDLFFRYGREGAPPTETTGNAITDSTSLFVSTASIQDLTCNFRDSIVLLGPRAGTLLLSVDEAFSDAPVVTEVLLITAVDGQRIEGARSSAFCETISSDVTLDYSVEGVVSGTVTVELFDTTVPLGFPGNPCSSAESLGAFELDFTTPLLICR